MALAAGLPRVTGGQCDGGGAGAPRAGGPGKTAWPHTRWAGRGRPVVGSSGVRYSAGTARGGSASVRGGTVGSAGPEGTGGRAIAPGRAMEVSATERCALNAVRWESRGRDAAIASTMVASETAEGAAAFGRAGGAACGKGIRSGRSTSSMERGVCGTVSWAGSLRLRSARASPEGPESERAGE